MFFTMISWKTYGLHLISPQKALRQRLEDAIAEAERHMEATAVGLDMATDFSRKSSPELHWNLVYLKIFKVYPLVI